MIISAHIETNFSLSQSLDFLPFLEKNERIRGQSPVVYLGGYTGLRPTKHGKEPSRALTRKGNIACYAIFFQRFRPPDCVGFLSSVLDFYQTQRLDTGREGSAALWQERQSRNLLLRRQSEEIADKLKLVGVDLYAPQDPEADTVTLLGDLSQETEDSLANCFRHSLFLPAIAASDRSRQMKKLELYLQRHRRSQFARYLVVTHGVRIAWHDADFRKKIAEFHNKLGTFARAARKQYGVEIVLRSTEMTLRDCPGQSQSGIDGVHLHANVLYIPPKLVGDRWQNWLNFCRRYFSSHVKDCGRIKNIREIVKYVTKPTASPSEREKIPGLVGMCQLSPARLAWLHAATQRLHIVQPLQNFRRFLHGLTIGRLKIYRSEGGTLELVQKPQVEKRAAREETGCRENVIITRTLPQPRFSEIYEPVSIVMNFTRNPRTADGKRALAELNRRHEEAKRWQAERAAREIAIENLTASAVIYRSHENVNSERAGQPPGAGPPGRAVRSGPVRVGSG